MTVVSESTGMESGFDYGQAIAEANRCLLCLDAPCSAGCPAGTDPGTFIRKFRLRNVTGAIRTIKENNPLGGACGVLCPTSSLCERNCSATGIDRPIRIGKLQRFLVEHSHDIGFRALSRGQLRTQKVAVVGSGPAGLSCAAVLAKEGYQVTVFERLPEPGGMMRYGVPARRFDGSLLSREIHEIVDLGVEIRCSSPLGGNGGAADLLKSGYHAVFLAHGLWGSVSGGETPARGRGIIQSLEFLKALRENRVAEMEELVRGRTVAVIGGGSVALDCAESALDLGPRDVYIIYRRSHLQMPAEEHEIVSALRRGVHFLFLTRPLEYLWHSDGSLKIRLIMTRLGDPDASGRRKPEDIQGTEVNFDAHAVIEAIGQKADDDAPGWYPDVKIDGKNLIVADSETCATSVPGIFAGGDIVRGPALIVEAVRDGKAAARSIAEYLKGR